MAAPVIRQSTGLLAPASPQTASTLQLPVWPQARLANSRIIVILGVTNNQNDGIGATVSDGASYGLTQLVTRQATGHDAVTLRFFQLMSAASGTARPTITFTGLPVGGVYVWAVAFEVTGDDPAAATDLATAIATGSAAAFTVGPDGPTTRPQVLWLAAAATPNIQATAPAAGSPFTQAAAGGSGGTALSAKATALVATLAQTTIGSAQFDAIVTGTTPPSRQYAAGLLAIPGPSGGGGGGGGSPRSFPLGHPDTTGYTVLDDPGIANPAALNSPWTPTDPALGGTKGMSNTKDYVLNAPQQRGRGIQIVGGGDVVVPLLLIKSVARDSELIGLSGGRAGALVSIGPAHLDPNGQQCDIMQTKSGFNRDLQLITVKGEKQIGSTDATTDPGGPAAGTSPTGGDWVGVHADFLQPAGGIGNIWWQDVEYHTTYQGAQLQREAKLGPGTSKTITSWTRSGTTLTITSAAHGLAAGKFVSHHGTAAAPIQGGFTVTGATTNTYTVELTSEKAALAASSGSGGTLQEISFAYPVGTFHARRVAGHLYPNTSHDPSFALGALRIGARTAPVNNSHPNEDQTRLTDDAAVSPLIDLDEYYVELVGGGTTVDNYVKPDSGSSTWSVIKAALNTAPTPDEVSWPNWPKTGTSKIKVGAPATPFVVIQGGVPVSTTSGGTGSPAPTNVNPPVLAPSTPNSQSLLTIATLGDWNNTDSATSWTVRIQRQLGTSGGYTSIVDQSGLTFAQAMAVTLQLDATTVGYQYRAEVIADNGSPSSTIDGAPTALVTQAITVTLAVTVE